MSCTCHSAALRLFVRSLAQVHAPAQPLAASSRAAAGYPPASWRRTSSLHPSTLGLAYRGLHSTRRYNSEAHAVAPSSTTEDHSAIDATPSKREQPEPRPGPVDNSSERNAPSGSTGEGAQENDAAASIQHPKKLKAKKKAAKAAHGAAVEATPIPGATVLGATEQEEEDLFTSVRPRKRVLRLKQPKPKTAKPAAKAKAADRDGEPAAGAPQEAWGAQKDALKQKFPEGWNPRKKLSPDALAGIRALHQQFPEQYTTQVLADKFEISPEAIRRILKSKWTPNSDEEISRQERWFTRGKKVWSRWAELGKKPPVRWRREGIVRDPSWNRPRGRTGHYRDGRDDFGSGPGTDSRSAARNRLARTLI